MQQPMQQQMMGPSKVPVAYERLSITSSEQEINNERACFLFDENQAGVASGSGTSKWLSKLNQGTNSVTLEIVVNGPPIRLTHYALKTANDCPGRDPKSWKLYGCDE